MNVTKERIKQAIVLLVIFLIGAWLLLYGYQTFQFIPRDILFINLGFGMIPVAIWLEFLYMRRVKNLPTRTLREREILLMLVVFGLGILTVPILGAYYGYIQTDGFDYYLYLYDLIVSPYEQMVNSTPRGADGFDQAVRDVNKMVAIYETITIIIDAWLEEILKVFLLIVFLRTMKLVNTIGDAITYSVLAGLGFAFIENVVFFVDIYMDPEKSADMYRSVVVFRSVVLNVAHMIFSGIFGYFYGLSKYGLPLFEEQKWEGKHFYFTRALSACFRISKARAYSLILFFEGMLIAMAIHAAFNTFLWFNLRDYAVYLVMGSGVYVYYLTQRKAGHLVLATLGRKRLSMMAPKDEDVVLELAGMWINEGKYKEVEEICERLEAKDPDNAVVKLLHARAHDKRRVKRAKLAFASLFFQEDIFEEDKSIFEHWNEIRLKREAEMKGVDFPDIELPSSIQSASQKPQAVPKIPTGDPVIQKKKKSKKTTSTKKNK